MKAPNNFRLHIVPTDNHVLETLPQSETPSYEASVDTNALGKEAAANARTQDIGNALEHVPKPQTRSGAHEPGLLTVKDLAARYGLKEKVIYEFIKCDPTFPYKNVGLKKKYMVDMSQYEAWLENRTNNEKSANFGVQSTDELLALFTAPKKGSSK